MVAPSRDVRDAGLLELVQRPLTGDPVWWMVCRLAHKIMDRMEVFPLPDAPIKSTLTKEHRQAFPCMK
jgi:hypothetical protein